MTPALLASARVSIQARLKLARLMAMDEHDFQDKVRSLEKQELFDRLVSLGVVRRQIYPGVRFSTLRLAGLELRASDGLPADTLDANGDLSTLLHRVGQERFEECFLRGDDFSESERAARCDLSVAEARRLTELVDRLYIQAEFAGAPQEAPSAPSLSPVAGIELEQGRPVLGFFNREIWQDRYKVDNAKRDQVLACLDEREAAAARRLLTDLSFVELRKSTLYRVLETVIELQAPYLASGDPQRRIALTQAAVASQLGIEPSILNRLIASKSVQLPWGLHAPLRAFMPSAKLLARDLLYDIAVAQPTASDIRLSAEMRLAHGVNLSRRSIAQYRKELGLLASGWRDSVRAASNRAAFAVGACA